MFNPGTIFDDEHWQALARGINEGGNHPLSQEEINADVDKTSEWAKTLPPEIPPD